MSRPIDDSKTESTINVRHIPRDLHRAFGARCRRKGHTMNEVLVGLMQDYCDNEMERVEQFIKHERHRMHRLGKLRKSRAA